MLWYLVHTKPRQEKVALQNLKQQGYPCYLPVLPSEKLRQGALALSEEPLFPRYLFIQLGLESTDKSWTPIRSTKGVCRLVSFGTKPAKVPDNIIAFLQAQEVALQSQPERLFSPGQRVCLTQGSFAGVEGIYQMADGERRVMVLIELMSKPVAISVAPTELRKVT
ncbi:MAG TPA: transcription/translation regulatory transformer protein RfaH [Rhodocyclaceae bacterium]|jgi:transcriptional antiterminator RfaH